MKKLLDFIKKHYIAISSTILCLSIVPFVLISFYSRPCSDDYSFSIEMIRMAESQKPTFFSVIATAWETNVRFYKTWNGLYISGFLQSLQPGAYLGEENYYAGTIFLMLFVFANIYFCIKTMYDLFDLKYSVVFSSLLLFSFFIHGMISTIQGLYWFCGAYDYIPFVFLTMTITSLMFRYYYAEKGKDLKYMIIATILSVINSGGNHITAFLNILILSCFTIVALYNRKKRGTIIVLISAIIGFMFVVFAPGTRVRMGRYDEGDVITTIVMTAKRAINLTTSYDYTLNLRFVAYITVLTVIALALRDNKRIKDMKVNPVLLFFVFAMFYCATLAVPYHAMGSFGSGRIKNAVWFTFMILIGLLYIYTVVWLINHFDLSTLTDKLNRIDYRLICILASIILVVSSRNMYSVVQELTDGTAQKFADQYSERYELMKKYRGSDELLVFDELIQSKNLYFDDISPNLDDWRNTTWNAYYQVKAIRKESSK